MQYIVWAMGVFAAYRLWEDMAWLSVIVAIVALSYAAHEDERAYYQAHGEFPTPTATRFLFTFLIVLGVTIYSLFV